MVVTLGSDVAKGLICAITNGKRVVTNAAFPRTSVATTSSALSLASARISLDRWIIVAVIARVHFRACTSAIALLVG